MDLTDHDGTTVCSPAPDGQEVKYHPASMPIPEGWERATGFESHHSRYSILIRRVR